MRVLYRFAILFALLVPPLCKADVTFTIDHSQRSERSFALAPDLMETVSGMPDRTARVTMDFTALHEMFEPSFDEDAGRAVRASTVHASFNTGLNVLRSGRGSRETESDTALAVVTTPEPGSLALLAAGLAGCVSLWPRRRS